MGNFSKIQEITDVSASIFGRGWHLFQINQYDKPYYHKVKIANRTIEVFDKKIKQKGGIPIEKKNNVYLANALPYFEFPVEVNNEDVEVNIEIDDKKVSENEEYSKITKGNKLIIDIIDYSLFDELSHKESEHSLKVDVCITYKDSKGLFSFYVSRQKAHGSFEGMYKYDRWGKEITGNNNGEVFISGNDIQCDEPLKVTGVMTRVVQDFSDNDLSLFYFINLLSARCFMNSNMPITHNVLKKCIRYAATRKGDINLESEYVSHFRNALVNSGYICASYEKGTHYQAIPPTFIKVPAPVTETGDLRNFRPTYMYMLNGCYTMHFLTNLLSFCHSNDIQVSIVKRDTSSSSIYSLLPPIILLNNAFAPQESSDENKCKWIDSDFALELLDGQPTVGEYEETLSPINERLNINGLKVEPESFPRVATDKGRGYCHKWIEESEGNYLESPTNNYDWMYLYCHWKRNKPLVLYEAKGILYVPKDVHLPFLYQRALFVMNIGQPNYSKVFVRDNDITDDPLYSIFKIYEIGTGANRLGTGANRLDKVTALLSPNRELKMPVLLKFFSLELWSLKDRFESAKPRYLLLLKHKGCNIGVAKKEGGRYSSYIKRADADECFVKVSGSASPNKVFSKIINETLQNQNATRESMGITFDPQKTFVLPNEDEYEKEEIKII